MKLITKGSKHDDFLQARFVSGNFLQASFWQDFLSAQNQRSWRLGIEDNGRLVATCLLYERKLPFGRSYLYAPKGPIVASDLAVEKRKEALEIILSQAREITIETKKQEEIFFKVEPEDNGILVSRLIKTADVQPRDTRILSLDKDLPELLAKMHPKTRYNISLAKKKGIKIKFSQEPKDIKYFLSLIKKTAKRNQIAVHSDDYYQKLYQTIIRHQAGALALAYYQDKVVAANILVRFGQATTYLHGASDYDYRQYMAPHLLQWESIKQAQQKGDKVYDFWGIAPEDGSKPSWQGITRFKKGFGGQALKSPGAYDLIYNKTWYSIYKLSKRILKA